MTRIFRRLRKGVAHDLEPVNRGDTRAATRRLSAIIPRETLHIISGLPFPEDNRVLMSYIEAVALGMASDGSWEVVYEDAMDHESLGDVDKDFLALAALEMQGRDIEYLLVGGPA